MIYYGTSKYRLLRDGYLQNRRCGRARTRSRRRSRHSINNGNPPSAIIYLLLPDVFRFAPDAFRRSPLAFDSLSPARTSRVSALNSFGAPPRPKRLWHSQQRATSDLSRAHAAPPPAIPTSFRFIFEEGQRQLFSARKLAPKSLRRAIGFASRALLSWRPRVKIFTGMHRYTDM